MPSSTGVTAFLIIGAALLAGHAAHVVGKRAHVPRVTILLLLGLACGPSALDVVPTGVSAWFPTISHVALAVVGFLLGEQFMRRRSRHGKRVLGLAVLITAATVAVVAAGAALMGAPLELALILGGIAAATDPAATLDVVRESKADGPLTNAVVGIVAVDDALGILFFSVLLAVAESVSAVGTPIEVLSHGLWEIGGAIAVGAALGAPMAWLTGRLRPGEPAILEVLGFILLTAAVTSLLNVSFVLASMLLGGMVSVLAKHHTRAVHEIEGFGDGVLAVFFLFAGFRLDIEAIPGIGVLGAAYLVTRVVGRLAGSWAGSRLVHAEPAVPRGLGSCLLPQAGVAIGLALLAAERLPEIGEGLITLTIAATVVFELAGPLATRWQLGRAGETSDRRRSRGRQRRPRLRPSSQVRQS